MTIFEGDSRTRSNSGLRFPVIQGIRVDLAAVASIAHRCSPTQCDAARFCCAQYEVCITPAEMEAIVGAMPLAAEYASHLRHDSGYRNVFEETEADLLVIDTDDNSLCLFAYPSIGGTLCALHSVAERLNRLPVDFKPQACTLWPLALAATRPATLSIQSDAHRFACNRIRNAPAPELDAGIAKILEMTFGEGFLRKVRRAVAHLF